MQNGTGSTRKVIQAVGETIGSRLKSDSSVGRTHEISGCTVRRYVLG
jgi:hypothetical protein